MKLISLTSTIPSFRSMTFKPGFNVILGEPKEKGTSRSHNLGKSTALRILEFVMFSGSGGFLDKVKERFPDSEFIVRYLDGTEQKTFTRGFRRRANGSQKEVQTSIDYDYFFRFQNEFDLDNGFRKPEFLGSDLTWKPRIVGLLGFNQELLVSKLTLNREVDELDKIIKVVRQTGIKATSHSEEISRLEKEKKEIIASLQELKLFRSDLTKIKVVVDGLDSTLSKLKPTLYEVESDIRRIESSLSRLHELSFDSHQVERVFNDVGLYFEQQIKHSIEELNSFYLQLYSNRRSILNERLKVKRTELEQLQHQSTKLDDERAQLLSQLSNAESISQYTDLHNQLVSIERRLALLNRDIISENVAELEAELSSKQTKSFEATATLSRHLDENRMKFDKINSIYGQIMLRVMKIEASIWIEKKSTGNIDLVLRSFRNGVETEELKGDTAKRISAAAIDIAIRCIQNDDSGFLAHDGVIDDVDANTAEEFVEVVKELLVAYDFQYIMTGLKDRVPPNVVNDDIIIQLHDYENEGLLMGFRY